MAKLHKKPGRTDENIVRLSPLFFKVSYATWTAAECPLTIEYAIEAVREVRRIANGRGGKRGVLYGRLDGQTLRIMRARAVPEGADERAWAKLAASFPSGLTAAGLFSVREEVALSRGDLEMLRAQFPAPWQVALIVTQSGRAGFFARDYDGMLDPFHCHLEFDISESDALVPVPFSSAALHRSRVAGRHDRSSMQAPVLKWAVAGLIAAGVGYGAALYEPAEKLQLGVQENENRMTISWNRAALNGAASGAVEILDGPNRVSFNLDPADLASSRLTYVRRTGDVSVRFRSNGLDHATRFLGRTTAATVRDEIEGFVQKSTVLLGETADRDTRIRELQTKVDLLNARVIRGATRKR